MNKVNIHNWQPKQKVLHTKVSISPTAITNNMLNEISKVHEEKRYLW